MAAGYRVDPGGVESVLADVGVAGEAIATALAPLEHAVIAAAAAADGTGGGTSCVVGVPSAGLISAALSAFMTDLGGDVGVIARRVPGASHGLHDASQAIIDGDGDIGAEVHAAMTNALYPMAQYGGFARGTMRAE